jgi:hypothetical protein
MSTTYKAQDIATIIRSTIANRGINQIPGLPMCYTLVKLLNQLFGIMWFCLPQRLYVTLNGENVTAPFQPPAIPPVNDITTPAHNTAIQVTWQKNKELWDQKNVNKALVEIAKAALDVARQ